MHGYGLIHTVYYHIYMVDGAILSNKMAISTDLSLGCVNTILIVPPHTVISMKHCLCHLERISNYKNTSLFFTASCKSLMMDANQVSIQNFGAELDVRPSEPMALVVMLPDPDQCFSIQYVVHQPMIL